MADAAARKGWHVSICEFTTGVKYGSKDLEVEDKYPTSANTAALKVKHDKKVEMEANQRLTL